MEKVTENSPGQKKIERLLAFLRNHKEDRGVMANLRCALVENKRYRAWPILGRFGGIGEKFSEKTVQTIAGLYATHPKETDNGDFGALCRKLLSDEESKKLASGTELGPLSRRFQHLLAADKDEILDRIVRFVLRAKAEDIPVNYEQLYEDLLAWEYRAEQVRVRWARNFWVPEAKSEVEPS